MAHILSTRYTHTHTITISLCNLNIVTGVKDTVFLCLNNIILHVGFSWGAIQESLSNTHLFVQTEWPHLIPGMHSSRVLKSPHTYSYAPSVPKHNICYPDLSPRRTAVCLGVSVSALGLLVCPLDYSPAPRSLTTRTSPLRTAHSSTGITRTSWEAKVGPGSLRSAETTHSATEIGWKPSGTTLMSSATPYGHCSSWCPSWHRGTDWRLP